jgi:hypothetical protein
MPRLTRQLLLTALFCSAPLFVFASVLLFNIPEEFRSILNFQSSISHSSFAIIALSLFLFYSFPGRLGTCLSLSFTLLLFALPLADLWNTGASNFFVLGGIVPSADANLYHWDALKLVEGGIFSERSNRPLFSAMLAVLLGLTCQNLHLTLAILVAIAGVSCFFVAREIQNSHGTAAGVLVIILMLIFFRDFVGQTMTESLGLPLGAIGFAIIWKNLSNKQISLSHLGLLLLTLGLLARAGTFFVLPAIILWGVWFFRGAGKLYWRFLIGGSSAIFMGFFANSILTKIVGFPDTVPFANYAYVLYGLSVRGNWTTVFNDHSDKLHTYGSYSESARLVFGLALKAIKENPLNLVHGAFRAWREFFTLPDWQHFRFFIFQYVNNALIESIVGILSIFGLVFCLIRIRQLYYSLILAMILGVLLSVPFIPPWDSGTRIYATTIPIVAVLPAIGLANMIKLCKWLLKRLRTILIPVFETVSSRLNLGILRNITMRLVKKLKSLRFMARSKDSKTPVSLDSTHSYNWSLIVCGMLLILFSCIFPIVLRLGSHLPQYPEITCSSDTIPVYFRASSGSSINVLDDRSITHTRVPNIRFSDFTKGLKTTWLVQTFPAAIEDSSIPKPPLTIMTVLDLKYLRLLDNALNGPYITLFAKGDTIPKDNSIIAACVKPVPTVRGYRVESIQNLSLMKT